MTDPGPDLHAAFQHWRSQEAQAAPAFTGLPAPASPPPGRHPLPILLRAGLPLSLAGAAALLAVMLNHQAPSPITLAEALPRPLLSPAPEEPAFLPSLAANQPPAPSDFLHPAPFSASLPFPLFETRN